jgi:predicted amidohydrolase YtcJ
MDMILFNGRIATMDDGNPEASAVLIRDGRFEYAGSDLEVMALADPDTRILDLMGRFVCPGFNDSHLHLLNYAYGLTKVDCGGAVSVDEIIERARHYLEVNIPSNPDNGSWEEDGTRRYFITNKN